MSKNEQSISTLSQQKWMHSCNLLPLPLEQCTPFSWKCSLGNFSPTQPLTCNKSSTTWLITHLINSRILSLSSIGHWGVTVWAIMLTIVKCSSGVSYNQQLLDLTLQESICRLNNKTKGSLQFIRSTVFTFRNKTRHEILRYFHMLQITYPLNFCCYYGKQLLFTWQNNAN